MNNDTLFIDINDFARDAANYFRRAAAGEKIILTHQGEPRYQVPGDKFEADKRASIPPRPKLTFAQYVNFLDILVPLDEQS